METVNGYQGNTPVAAPAGTTPAKQAVTATKIVDTQSVLKR
jgi:ubiquitin-conjugating enzyme E2 C